MNHNIQRLSTKKWLFILDLYRYNIPAYTNQKSVVETNNFILVKTSQDTYFISENGACNVKFVFPLAFPRALTCPCVHEKVDAIDYVPAPIVCPFLSIRALVARLSPDPAPTARPDSVWITRYSINDSIQSRNWMYIYWFINRML